MVYKRRIGGDSFDSGNEAPLANLKKTYTADKTELEKLLTASALKLEDAERSTQKLEHTKDTLDVSATKIGEAEARLRGSADQVFFLDKKLSEQSNRLLSKDTSATVYQERIVVLERELTRLSADVKRLTTQHTDNKDLPDSVRTVLDLQKTASQHHTSRYFKELEKLLAENLVL